MRRTIFIVVILLTGLHAKPQITKAYLFGAAGVQTNEGIALHAGSSIVLNKWIITVAYLDAKRNANVPHDFKVHRGTGYPGLEFETYPRAETRFLYISGGRYFRYSRRVNFTLDAGVGISNGDLLSFDRTIDSRNNRFSPNYSIEFSRATSVGSIIRTGIDVSLANFAGMGFDLYYNYNGGGLHDYFGLNLRLMMGCKMIEY